MASSSSPPSDIGTGTGAGGGLTSPRARTLALAAKYERRVMGAARKTLAEGPLPSPKAASPAFSREGKDAALPPPALKTALNNTFSGSDAPTEDSRGPTSSSSFSVYPSASPTAADSPTSPTGLPVMPVERLFSAPGPPSRLTLRRTSQSTSSASQPPSDFGVGVRKISRVHRRSRQSRTSLIQSPGNAPRFVIDGTLNAFSETEEDDNRASNTRPQPRTALPFVSSPAPSMDGESELDSAHFAAQRIRGVSVENSSSNATKATFIADFRIHGPVPTVILPQLPSTKPPKYAAKTYVDMTPVLQGPTMAPSHAAAPKAPPAGHLLRTRYESSATSAERTKWVQRTRKVTGGHAYLNVWKQWQLEYQKELELAEKRKSAIALMSKAASITPVVKSVSMAQLESELKAEQNPTLLPMMRRERASAHQKTLMLHARHSSLAGIVTSIDSANPYANNAKPLDFVQLREMAHDVLLEYIPLNEDGVVVILKDSPPVPEDSPKPTVADAAVASSSATAPSFSSNLAEPIPITVGKSAVSTPSSPTLAFNSSPPDVPAVIPDTPSAAVRIPLQSRTTSSPRGSTCSSNGDDDGYIDEDEDPTVSIDTSKLNAFFHSAASSRITCKAAIEEFIVEKYTLEEIIGEGAYGSVYKSRRKDGLSNAVFAVKIQQGNREKKGDVINELNVMASIAALAPSDSPAAGSSFVIRMLDHAYFEDEKGDWAAFISMSLAFSSLSREKIDLCDAGMKIYTDDTPAFDVTKTTDKEVLQAIATRSRAWKHIKAFALSILRGLDFLHSIGIAHCDLKPENVLLMTSTPDAPSLDDCNVVLADLGLACQLDPSTPNPEQWFNGMVGTHIYQSPECWKGICGPKGDVWSFGILLLELVTGFTPLQMSLEDPREMHSWNEYQLRDRAKEFMAFWNSAPKSSTSSPRAVSPVLAGNSPIGSPFPELSEEEQELRRTCQLLRDLYTDSYMPPKFLEFVGKCLTPQRFQRPTVAELLRHEFVAEGTTF